MNLNRRDFIAAPAATIAATSLLFAADPAVPWQRNIRNRHERQRRQSRWRRLCSVADQEGRNQGAHSLQFQEGAHRDARP